MLFGLTGCLKEAAKVMYDAAEIPTGTIAYDPAYMVNGKYTNIVSLSVNLTYANATEMALFIDTDCSYFKATSWLPVAASHYISLPDRDGTHKISVIYRNAKHYYSSCQTTELVVDRVPPAAPATVTVHPRSTTLSASALFGFATSVDSLTPTIGHEARVVELDGTDLSGWISVETGGPADTTVNHYLKDLTLVDGTSYAVEVRGVDSAGNVSAPTRSASFEAGPVLTFNYKYFYAPAGSFAIQLTSSRALTTPLEVSYWTEDETAFAGVDFVGLNSKVTLPASATSTYVGIIMHDSQAPGGSRSFYIAYSDTPSDVHTNYAYYETLPNQINENAVVSTASSLLTVGPSSACVVNQTTNVACLGSASSLGNGAYVSSTPSSTGVPVPGLTGTIQKIVSGGQTCALMTNGLVKCWGSNFGNGIGNGTAGTSPFGVITVPLTGVIDISASYLGTCAVLNTGRVYCWGVNQNGRFGNGTTTSSVANTSPTGYGPSDTPNPKPVQVAVGVTHMCLLFEDGSVKCTGKNDLGNLGNGNPVVTQSTTLIAAATPAGIQKLYAGAYSTCGSLSNGEVHCWGSFGFETIGLPSPPYNPFFPTHTPLLDNSKKLALGGTHGCAINATDDLYCWGNNALGQLATPYLLVRQPYSRATNFTAKAQDIAVGDFLTCATSTAGEAYCWGTHDYATGEYLADANPGYTPRQHETLGSDVTTLRMGYGLSCVIKTDDSPWCWGTNVIASTEISTNEFYSVEARRVFPNAVYDVSSGYDHFCVVEKPSRKVFCKGKNAYGQLGNGSTTPSESAFVEVAGLSNTDRISAGVQATCALSTTGQVRCWGNNNNLQLGSNVGATSSTPILVPGIPSMKQIGMGRLHACALTATGGNVYCWGSNAVGQMGNGTSGGTSAPTQVSTIAGASLLTVGGVHACAKHLGVANYCWGNNSYGQFGNGGSAATNATPVIAGFQSGSTFMAATESNTCVVVNGSYIQCSGSNNAGALGAGPMADSTVPRAVQNVEMSAAEVGYTITYDAALSAGGVVGCALLKNPGAPSGRVLCWGSYGYGAGQKGRGRSIPLRLKFD
jgi:alpha-tubulin suppressor-like RCC1 family protein